MTSPTTTAPEHQLPTTAELEVSDTHQSSNELPDQHHDEHEGPPRVSSDKPTPQACDCVFGHCGGAPCLNDYSWVDWWKINGGPHNGFCYYQPPVNIRFFKGTSYIWRYGCKITESGTLDCWLCRYCHTDTPDSVGLRFPHLQIPRGNKQIFPINKTLAEAKKRLAEKHWVHEEEQDSQRRLIGFKRTWDESYKHAIPTTEPGPAGHSGPDHLSGVPAQEKPGPYPPGLDHFGRLLLKWLDCDPPVIDGTGEKAMIESLPFHQMIHYLRPETIGHLPCLEWDHKDDCFCICYRLGCDEKARKGPTSKQS